MVQRMFSADIAN